MKNIVYRCKLTLSMQRKLRDLFLAGSTAIERLAEYQKIGAKNEVVEVDECYTSGGKGGSENFTKEQ